MRISHNIKLEGGKNPSNPINVYIGTPTATCRPVLKYTASLANTTLELYKNNIGTVIKFAKSDAFIARARNMLIDDFLKSDCTHILMIDDDQGWDYTKLPDMISKDKDALFCVVRQKEEKENYAIRVNVDEKTMKCKEKDGLISCSMIGMAFCLIKREVFEKMNNSLDLPITKDSGVMYTDVYIRDTGRRNQNLKNIYDWVGEDYDFCEKLDKAGIEKWIYPDIDISHVGTIVYENNFHKYLCKQPGGSKSTESLSPIEYKIKSLDNLIKESIL